LEFRRGVTGERDRSDWLESDGDAVRERERREERVRQALAEEGELSARDGAGDTTLVKSSKLLKEDFNFRGDEDEEEGDLLPKGRYDSDSGFRVTGERERGLWTPE